MRRMLLAAAAAVLLLPSAGFAQGLQNPGPEQGQEQGRRHQAEGQRQRPQAVRPQAARPGPRAEGPRQNLAQNQDRREAERRDNDRRDAERRDNDRRGDARNRDRDRRFTFRGRDYAAVRAPAFHYPRGWGYRAWRTGDVLPRLFIAPPYFIDFAYLGLPPTPPGTRWVRYGPDALLVDVRNGRVVDVIYNAFFV